MADQADIRAFLEAERSQSEARLHHNHLERDSSDSSDSQAAVVEPCLDPDKELGKSMQEAVAFREVSKQDLVTRLDEKSTFD